MFILVYKRQALLPVQTGDGQECPFYAKPFDLKLDARYAIFHLVLVPIDSEPDLALLDGGDDVKNRLLAVAE